MRYWGGRFGWCTAKPARSAFWLEAPAKVASGRPPSFAASVGADPADFTSSGRSSAASTALVIALRRSIASTSGATSGSMSGSDVGPSPFSSTSSLAAGGGFAAPAAPGAGGAQRASIGGLSKRPSITLARRDSISGPRSSRRVSWSDEAVFAGLRRSSESPLQQGRPSLAAERRQSGLTPAGRLPPQPAGHRMRRSLSEPNAALRAAAATASWLSDAALARHSFSETSSRVSEHDGAAARPLVDFASLHSQHRRNSLVGQTVPEHPTEEEVLESIITGITWKRLSEEQEEGEEGDDQRVPEVAPRPSDAAPADGGEAGGPPPLGGGASEGGGGGGS